MAFPLRGEGYNLLVLSEWMDANDNDACTRLLSGEVGPAWRAEARYVRCAPCGQCYVRSRHVGR